MGGSLTGAELCNWSQELWIRLRVGQEAGGEQSEPVSHETQLHSRTTCKWIIQILRTKKKKNQIREKLETDFCIGTSAPAGVWVQDFCSDGVCCLLVFTRNTFVLMKWVLGARTTGEQHSAYACFSTAYNNPLPPLVEKQTASFLLVPPERGGMRYFITQIRMRTEAPLQERRGGRVLLVKYGLVLVKLVWLIHCWGAGAEPVSLHLAGLLFPRCAARQDEWTPTCRGVESTSSITVCAFWLLLCNFVCMQGEVVGVSSDQCLKPVSGLCTGYSWLICSLACTD